MANERASATRYEYATVNEAPPSAGYGTNAVSPNDKHVEQIFFSVMETGDSSAFSATVTLQFRTPGSTDWQDYEDYTAVTRQLITGKTGGVAWRGVVKNAAYTSGEVTFGFDW